MKMSTIKHALLKGVNEVLTYFQHYSSDVNDAGDVPKTSSSQCEFRNNFRSKIHTLLRGRSEILSLLSTFDVHFEWCSVLETCTLGC